MLTGAGIGVHLLPRPQPDAAARVRDPAPVGRGGHHDHRQPQPGRRQRLQALPGRWRTDRAAGRRADRGGDRRPRPAVADPGRAPGRPADHPARRRGGAGLPRRHHRRVPRPADCFPVDCSPVDSSPAHSSSAGNASAGRSAGNASAGTPQPGRLSRERPRRSASRRYAPLRPLRVVYTALHGVAASLALRAIERAGFPPPLRGRRPGRSPTPTSRPSRSPTPRSRAPSTWRWRRPGRTGADLVLANDPDGDRLAVAVPDPAAPGGWRALSGDQVGALLGCVPAGKDGHRAGCRAAARGHHRGLIHAPRRRSPRPPGPVTPRR